jgi:aspartate oxidase
MQLPAQAAPAGPDRVWMPDPPAGPAAPLPMTVEDIRDLMWRDVGLFRRHATLAAAVARLDQAVRAAEAQGAADAGRQSTLHLATVALRIARAALYRTESRGGHFRADFPDRDEVHWRAHVVASRQ